MPVWIGGGLLLKENRNELNDDTVNENICSYRSIRGILKPFP